MNIIYMHTHDSGRYWSPYGLNVPTPNIQAFAQTATVFRQAYCAGPTCSPSRSGLLTGICPHKNGMQGLAHLGWRLNDYNQHLNQYLQQNGYHTALCGIQHEAPDYKMLGYNEVIGSQEFDMGNTVNSMEDWDYGNTKEACAFLARQKERSAPFFLSFGLFNTHREYPHAKERDGIIANYLAPPGPLYDCEVNRREMADYCASVKVVDHCFGRLLESLAKTGLADDTIVIMTTDHGIAMPRMKCTLYDTGIGVALIIRLPGVKQIRATDALVSQLDIFPTVCEVCGLEPPNWLQGVDLNPLIKGETRKVRTEIFAEVTYHAAYEPKRCIRTERHKLIRRYDYHNGIVAANIDDCISKDFLMENGYADTVIDREALFDLWQDPYERVNLVSDPRYRSIYNELSTRLETWMLETEDPLITHGSRVPKPENAKIIPLECPSPRAGIYEK
ncbi:MAG: sulfatase [Treponema sp.]|jgi:arylsulfatase A-like enzyme|nr:sulfatase [Treponema sp.]